MTSVVATDRTRRGIIEVDGNLWSVFRRQIIDLLEKNQIYIVQQHCEYQVDRQQLRCISERFDSIPQNQYSPCYVVKFVIDCVMKTIEWGGIEKRSDILFLAKDSAVNQSRKARADAAIE